MANTEKNERTDSLTQWLTETYTITFTNHNIAELLGIGIEERARFEETQRERIGWIADSVMNRFLDTLGYDVAEFNAEYESFKERW